MHDDVGAELERPLKVRRRERVVDDEERADLVRLSVGIESVEDLILDLENALVPAAVARA